MLKYYVAVENLHRDVGAGFGVGEGVVMIGQIEAAMCRDGVQLMVLQIGKDLD